MIYIYDIYIYICVCVCAFFPGMLMRCSVLPDDFPHSCTSWNPKKNAKVRELSLAPNIFLNQLPSQEISEKVTESITSSMNQVDVEDLGATLEYTKSSIDSPIS